MIPSVEMPFITEIMVVSSPMEVRMVSRALSRSVNLTAAISKSQGLASSARMIGKRTCLPLI